MVPLCSDKLTLIVLTPRENLINNQFHFLTNLKIKKKVKSIKLKKKFPLFRVCVSLPIASIGREGALYLTLLLNNLNSFPLLS